MIRKQVYLHPHERGSIDLVCRRTLARRKGTVRKALGRLLAGRKTAR